MDNFFSNQIETKDWTDIHIVQRNDTVLMFFVLAQFVHGIILGAPRHEFS